MSSKADVLVVDDSEAIREMLSLQLSSAGYHTVSTTNAEEAFSIALRTKPEVVIADLIMMPCNGIELCQKFRNHPVLRQVYFILLTGCAEQERELTALNEGVDEYLTKPWQQDFLLARVRTGLRIRQMQQEIGESRYNQAMLELAVTLAHEINNPLTALIGNLNLLKEGLTGKKNSRLIHFADQVTSQSNRISDVVKKLMSISKPRTKTYHADQKMVDLESR